MTKNFASVFLHPVLFIVLNLLKVVLCLPEPEFVEPVPNVTVAKGQDAVLPCLVRNLGPFRVGWFFMEKEQVLTVGKSQITLNYRIKLIHTEPYKWVLHVSDVRLSDRGRYMCQINTNPMKHQVGYLDVYVPPDILAEDTSTDITVDEGNDVTLRCKASGYPEPTIIWQREDQGRISLNGKGSQKVLVKEFEGQYLHFDTVNRKHSGGYLCIASNGIPPSVSRLIVLNVRFLPSLWTQKQVLSAALGQSLVLTCHVESYPKAMVYWRDPKGHIIRSNNRTVTTERTKLYKLKMKLRIRRIEKYDFGTFTCSAKSSLGEAEGTIRIYEKVITTTEKPTEPSYHFFEFESSEEDEETEKEIEEQTEKTIEHEEDNSWLESNESADDFQNYEVVEEDFKSQEKEIKRISIQNHPSTKRDGGATAIQMSSMSVVFLTILLIVINCNL